jgi:hypothetical protein
MLTQTIMMRLLILAIIFLQESKVSGFNTLRPEIKSKMKITLTTDSQLPMRIGHGFDIHRLVENRKLIIGKNFDFSA